VDEVDGSGVLVDFHFLRKGVGQRCEPAAAHADGQVLAFDMAG
jgi:hypothetical protein